MVAKTFAQVFRAYHLSELREKMAPVGEVSWISHNPMNAMSKTPGDFMLICIHLHSNTVIYCFPNKYRKSTSGWLINSVVKQNQLILLTKHVN